MSCEHCSHHGLEVEEKGPREIGAPVMYECCRFPPTVHMVAVPHPMSPGQVAMQQIQVNPRVPGEYICGEYERL